MGRINQTYGMHVGFYEEGIKNYIDVSLNMDNYVGRLLELKKDLPMKILDAGCGVGGTSVHLAKTYPNINFTGITIVPKQVELAKKYSIENKIENVDFILDDFNKTSFTDNYFDGIFAIESISHSYNIEELIKEMYRILKPGGRLVIINIFHNDKPLNYFMEKIYRSSLDLQATPGVVTIKVFEKYLKSKGFLNIKINNISKNINNTSLAWIIFIIPFFLYFIIKKTLKLNKHKKSSDIDYFSDHIVLSTILSLKNIMIYYAITADKKCNNINKKSLKK